MPQPQIGITIMPPDQQSPVTGQNGVDTVHPYDATSTISMAQPGETYPPAGQPGAVPAATPSSPPSVEAPMIYSANTQAAWKARRKGAAVNAYVFAMVGVVIAGGYLMWAEKAFGGDSQLARLILDAFSK